MNACRVGFFFSFRYFCIYFLFRRRRKKIVELTNKSKKVMINLLQTEKTRQFFVCLFLLDT